MENNNPNQASQPQPAVATSPVNLEGVTAATPTAAATPVTASPKSGPSILLIVLFVLLLGGLIAGGFYFYTTNFKSEPEVTQTKPTNEVASLEEEIDSAVLENIEGDFTAIDRDLNSL